jgi:hypothetical protein
MGKQKQKVRSRTEKYGNGFVSNQRGFGKTFGRKGADIRLAGTPS